MADNKFLSPGVDPRVEHILSWTGLDWSSYGHCGCELALMEVFDKLILSTMLLICSVLFNPKWPKNSTLIS